MKRYAEYKDSGIGWIGEIPSNWGALPVKRLATEKSSLFLDGDWIESDVIEESGIRYLTTGNIGNGFFKEQGGGYVSDKTFVKLKCLEVFPNDLVISRLNQPLGRACLIPYTHNRYVVAVDNVVLRPDKGYHKKYILYCMNSQRYNEMALLVARGATMQRISRTILGSLYLPVPSLATQECIADYLDRKTDAIDKLISDKQKLVALLQEKRSAVISETVTKGLDKTAKMKDSGIEWIGAIPEGWMPTKFKYFTSKIGSGKTPKGGNEVYADEGIVFIRSQNVYNTGLILDDVAYITVDMDKDLANTRLEFNDVLLNVTGASIGRSCVWVEANIQGNVNQHVCIIRSNGNAIPQYIHYGLISNIGQTFIDLCQTGANRQGLNFEQIANFTLPLPRFEEQKFIVTYLNQKTAQIDALISDINNQIEKLKEYRQAVISEAVTGKVAV